MRMRINGCLVELVEVPGHGFKATVGEYGLCTVWGSTAIAAIRQIVPLVTEES